MKKLIFCAGLIFLIGSFCSYGQEILTIKEVYSGKTEEIEAENEVIDINSSLELSLFKERLKKSINSTFPDLGKQLELENEISRLEQALKNQNLILQTLNQKMPSIQQQNKFFFAMLEFLQSTESLGLEEKVNNLYRQYFVQGIDNYIPYPAIYIFGELTSDLESLQQELVSSEVSPIQISLVAFKKDKQGGGRIHVQNFDTYKDGEYKVIERWVTTLTPKNKEQLKKVSEFSAENQTLTKEIFSEIKSSLEEDFQGMECLRELKIKLGKIVSDEEFQKKLSQDLQKTATELNTGLGKLIITGDLLSTNIAQWEITSPFVLSELFSEYYNSSQNFYQRVDASEDDIEKIIATIPELQGLEQDVVSCTNTWVQNVEDIRTTIEFQKQQQRNYVANKNIGEEVLKFGLDNLPEMGIVDLKKTGERQNGDEIEINVILRRPASNPALSDQDVVLEQKNLTMQMIGVHSEVVVGLIMADPWKDIERSGGNDRRFFYAPAASLLLKFGFRDFKFYNEFLQPGIGINFASPDFDTDGDPEFGTGIILTAFKDVLSVGINYNVTHDAPYWFFGVNLPFNLPGIPVTGVGNID